ncbi:hypothetical protein BX600DRAFT_505396 [Xylariales sp. PMI_506]|nr:hypothetical protein BX600DRAFT_505396 [Xylariales sp. PMI_506]
MNSTARVTSATPLVGTTTISSDLAAYSSLQAVPALLTRYTPSSQCSTDWFWDTGLLRYSSTIFSDATHNSQYWSTCQPYNQTAATYSAGICPISSEFKTVTSVSWMSVASPFFSGACCHSDAFFSTYISGDSTSTGCFQTVTATSVAAALIEDNKNTTSVTAAGPLTVIAEPLYMIWHQTDTSLHPTSDASSLIAAMGSYTTGYVESTSPVIFPQSYNSSRTGPSGAVIGLSVAFAICTIAVAVLGYFAFRRRWQRGGAYRQRHYPAASGGTELGGAAAPRQFIQTLRPSPGVESPRSQNVSETRVKPDSTTRLQRKDPPVAAQEIKPAEEYYRVEQKMLLR